MILDSSRKSARSTLIWPKNTDSLKSCRLTDNWFVILKILIISFTVIMKLHSTKYQNVQFATFRTILLTKLERNLTLLSNCWFWHFVIFRSLTVSTSNTCVVLLHRPAVYVRLLLRPTQDWKVAGLRSASSTAVVRLLLCFSEVWSRQSSTSFLQAEIERSKVFSVSLLLGRFLEDLLKGTSSLLSKRQITPLYNSLHSAVNENDKTSICWFSTMISSFQNFPFMWEDDKV